MYKIDVTKVVSFSSYAIEECKANPPINWELILGMIGIESNGKIGAVGSSKELGLMQITPIALIDINNFLQVVEGVTITSDQLLEPFWNIKAGTTYLWLRYKQHRDMDRAIRSYNAGDKAVQENRDSKLYLTKVRQAEAQVKDYYA